MPTVRSRTAASASQSVSIATVFSALAGIGWFVSVALSFFVKGRDGDVTARVLIDHPIQLALSGVIAVGFLGAAWLLSEERRSGALLLLGLSFARILVAVTMGRPSIVSIIVGLLLPAVAYAAYRELTKAAS